jgi:hypothetical protein
MFKWMRSRRRHGGSESMESMPKSSETDRDSGEEEYESHEDEAEEVSPDGMTRMKTEDI